MIRNILTGAEKAINIIGKVIVAVGIVVLLGMMLMTVIDVFLRYVFNRPITGGMEITQLMMVTISFIMLLFCTMRKTHVKVDLLANFIPRKVQRVIDSIFYLSSLIMFSFMSIYNLLESRHLNLVDQTTDILEIPLFPFYLLIAVASGMVVLLLVVFLINNIFGLEEK